MHSYNVLRVRSDGYVADMEHFCIATYICFSLCQVVDKQNWGTQRRRRLFVEFLLVCFSKMEN